MQASAADVSLNDFGAFYCDSELSRTLGGTRSGAGIVMGAPVSVDANDFLIPLGPPNPSIEMARPQVR